jgi:DNA polymerase-3 subunit delta'
LLPQPPEKTLFLLVANNDGQIISTITSRTQLIKIPQLTDEEITAGLVAQCDIGSSEAAGIAHLSDGSFNTALQLHEEGSTDKGFAQIYLQWLRDCYSYSKVAAKLIGWVDEIPKLQREGQKSFLQYGMHITRECLMMNYGSPELIRLFGEELDGFQKLSPFIHQGNATDIYESLNLACQHIERNANPRIVFMDLSLKMAKLLHSKQQ